VKAVASGEPATDVCIVMHGPLGRDTRVLNEARSLAAGGLIVVVVAVSVSGDVPGDDGETQPFRIVNVVPRLGRIRLPGTGGKLLRLALALPEVRRTLRSIDARAYHAQKFVALGLVALAGIAPRLVVYDSRELFFDQWPAGTPYPLKHLIGLLRPWERCLARRADAVIAESPEIAGRLVATLDIASPTLVLNSVDLRHLAPAAAVFPSVGRVRVAHSGSLVPGRHLVEIVGALAHLPAEVGLVLMGDGPLRGVLAREAERSGVGSRVAMVPFVPPTAVAPTLAQADAALVLVQSAGAHYDLTLPNKLFEAIAAGLPVVGSATTALRRVVTEHGLGVVCDPADPRSIARAIAVVTGPEAPRYRANVRRAAAELNWEADERRLLDLYAALFSRPSR
jgi:glycosyltransferase involved in cell wall biosynthesis